MNRRYLLLALVLALIGGCAWVLQRLLFPDAAKALEVVEVRGGVSVSGAGGSRNLTAGAKIQPGEQVKTGAESEAIMRGAGSSTITVSERSSVTVGGVFDGVARIDIDEGIVRSRVKEGEGYGVRMTGGRDKASVTTRGGDVAVGVDADGGLAAAVFEGKADLEHDGVTRALGKGQQAVVAGGKVEVGDLSTALLLKVAWPATGQTREPKTEVALTLPEGAMALVTGRADGPAVQELHPVTYQPATGEIVDLSRGGDVLMAWSQVPGAGSYRVRVEIEGTGGTVLDERTERSAHRASLAEGAYCFRVRTEEGERARSSKDDARPRGSRMPGTTDVARPWSPASCFRVVTRPVLKAPKSLQYRRENTQDAVQRRAPEESP